MKSSFLEILKAIERIGKRIKVKIVIMGGIAVGFYSYPRTTYDIDAVAILKEDKIKDFLKEAQKQRLQVDKKTPIKTIHNLPFITLYSPLAKIYIDIFIAITEFQKDIVKRAKRLKVDGAKIYLISAEDLILVKLQTQREKDLKDARQIIKDRGKGLDFNYLYLKSSQLGIKQFLQDEIRSIRVS